jgi:hypothetical protein
MWNFRGVEFLSTNKDTLWTLLWRPRPLSLLPPEKSKVQIPGFCSLSFQWLEAPKNFQEFQKKYKEKDLIEEEARRQKVAAEREEKRREYRKWLAKRRAEWKV